MMIDGDPERLLKAALSCSTRELLLAAKADEAPRAVRDRVLSTLAAAFARAPVDSASVPSTRSGVFEKRNGAGEAGAEASEPRSFRPAAPRASGVFRGASGQASPWSLGAAVVAGVLVAKGAHLTAEALGSRSEAATPAMARATATQPVAAQRPPAASARRSEPASVSTAIASPGIGARPGRSCGAGCLPPEARHATFDSGVNTGVRARRSTLQELAAEPAADLDEDWLGEQLELLSRAERSLLEGNPDGAQRSIDEYEVRFPKGLLDPQMGALRTRVQPRVEAFIFP